MRRWPVTVTEYQGMLHNYPHGVALTHQLVRWFTKRRIILIIIQRCRGELILVGGPIVHEE